MYVTIKIVRLLFTTKSLLLQSKTLTNKKLLNSYFHFISWYMRRREDNGTSASFNSILMDRLLQECFFIEWEFQILSIRHVATTSWTFVHVHQFVFLLIFTATVAAGS